VVRQVTGESLIQGLFGGVIGVAVGTVGAFAIDAFGPTLQATVSAAAEQGPRAFGPFGQGAIEPSATQVALDAPISPTIVVLAVGLALLGGLVAGAVGSLRASRLRPADALRHID
jgi:ABC-type antimicrobial peptide transport system permease subunit